MRLIRYRDIEQASSLMNYLESIPEKNNYDILYNEFIDNLTLSKELYNSYDNFIGTLNVAMESLLKNSSLSEYKEKEISLFTLCVLLIAVKEDQDFLNENRISVEELDMEIKSILEELKLIGIGNGIVKSSSEILKSIFDTVRKIKGLTIKEILNSNINNFLKSFIEKNSINLENFNSNFDRVVQALEKFNKLRK